MTQHGFLADLSLVQKAISMGFLVQKLPSQRMPIGHFGQSFATDTALTPISMKSSTQSPSYKCLRSNAKTADFPPMESPSQLAGYRLSSVQWARRSKGWGPLILEGQLL